LADACAPLIVVATRPADHYEPGQAIRLDVHAVSDLRAAVEKATVTAALTWAGGSRTWRWEGDVPPDSCVKVGTVEVEAPPASGPLVLELALRSPAANVTNRYESLIN
jgi:hypothetical protein